MSDYIIRKIPAQVWAKFTARARSEGRSFLFVLHKLIGEYIQHGLRKD
jgi:hypothetical protein